MSACLTHPGLSTFVFLCVWPTHWLTGCCVLLLSCLLHSTAFHWVSHHDYSGDHVIETSLFHIPVRFIRPGACVGSHSCSWRDKNTGMWLGVTVILFFLSKPKSFHSHWHGFKLCCRYCEWVNAHLSAVRTLPGFCEQPSLLAMAASFSDVDF